MLSAIVRNGRRRLAEQVDSATPVRSAPNAVADFPGEHRQYDHPRLLSRMTRSRRCWNMIRRTCRTTHTVHRCAAAAPEPSTISHWLRRRTRWRYRSRRFMSLPLKRLLRFDRGCVPPAAPTHHPLRYNFEDNIMNLVWYRPKRRLREPGHRAPARGRPSGGTLSTLQQLLRHGNVTLFVGIDRPRSTGAARRYECRPRPRKRLARLNSHGDRLHVVEASPLRTVTRTCSEQQPSNSEAPSIDQLIHPQLHARTAGWRPRTSPASPAGRSAARCAS